MIDKMTDTNLDKDLFENGGWVKHYKGNVYFVHGIFTHTETGEQMVAYSNMDKAWARPLSMFFDTVQIKTGIEPRFRKALPEEIESHIRGLLQP